VAHVAIAARNLSERSLYVDRDRVVRAIVERNHRLVGERRPDAWRSGGSARIRVADPGGLNAGSGGGR
jgi:hypothetical protein